MAPYAELPKDGNLFLMNHIMTTKTDTTLMEEIINTKETAITETLMIKTGPAIDFNESTYSVICH